MDPKQDDFLQLRRLLAIKRHEQPPPGYFDNFSCQVIGRLRAGEATPKFSLVEMFSWDAPWLQSLLGLAQNRPILAGGFGFAACSLLVAGLLISEPNNAQELTSGPLATAGAVLPQFQAVTLAVPYSGRAPVEPVSPADQLSGSIFQQLKQLPQHTQLIDSPAPNSVFH